MKQETLNRIDSISNTLGSMEQMRGLYGPLMLTLLSIRKELDMNNKPKVCELSKDAYKKQYEAGINRAAGLDIVWI